VTKLDDMLKEWPMRELSQLEVDESAERMTAAVSAGQMPSAIDESLLAPPLPKMPDEGQTSAPRTSRPFTSPQAGTPASVVENKMSKDRTRDRTSFQELAKLASTTPPPPTSSSTAPPAGISGAVVRGKEAESSDSGIVDLKMMAALDPTASQRAQSTPLAASGLFEDESAPPKPAVTAAAAQQALSAPPPSGAAPAVAQTAPAPVASAKSSVAPPKKADEKKGGGGVVMVLSALVAAAAIAAGGFFFIKHQRAAHLAAGPTTTAAPTVAATTKATATTTAVASVAITDTQEQGDPNVAVDPTQAGKPSMGKYHAKSGGPVATATGGGETPAPTGTIDPKLVANIPTGGAGGSGGDLQEAMKTAAGGGTGLGGGGTAQTNTQAAGNVAQRPSQGQVAGAIGSVMPAAKACLNGDEPLSRATVTFQSDGTVKSVNVSGFAAGKPQEACIKAALSKATVSPFAEATYPVPVTIRAN
jgi:hypothetical protein